ncbi:MAG: HAD hydrolase-like protein [Treponema sp.]
MKDYIFFDLDGTLTDSQEGILNSLRYALKLYGIEFPDDKLKTFIGPPMLETFGKLGFDESEIRSAVKKYREYYEANGIFENRVYDGVENMLVDLKNSGKRLAVATSKPEEYAARILEHFGIARYFDCICGCRMDESRADKAEVIAYALESCSLTAADAPRVLMAGDRYADIVGAHKNSVCCAAVLYGYGSRSEFEKYGADYIVETVPELQALIKTL